MIKTGSIASLGYALSPVVHNEVMAFGYNATKGEAKKQRTMPIIVEKDVQDGDKTIRKSVGENIPIVSGNAIRGIERRLLIDHSLDALGIEMDKLFSNKEDARRVMYFLRNGGHTPKGISADKIQVGTYEEIQSKLPFLLALGGVYQGHHFEGYSNIGILIPMTTETFPMYENIISDSHLKIIKTKKLPAISALKGNTAMRYTRRAGEEQTEDKEAMIYGTETIPAGTYFYSWSSVVTPYESAVLAFRAMSWLLAEYGIVGGMSGRGHGRIKFSSIYNDGTGERELIEEDYTEYIAYIKSHKQDIEKALKAIPEALKFTDKSKKEAS